MFHDVFRCGEITINVGEATRVPLIRRQLHGLKRYFAAASAPPAWQMPYERSAGERVVNGGVELSDDCRGRAGLHRKVGRTLEDFRHGSEHLAVIGILFARTESTPRAGTVTAKAMRCSARRAFVFGDRN